MVKRSGAATFPAMTKWHVFWFSALAGVAACSLEAEPPPGDKPCPAIACVDGLVIDFTLREPGQYALTLTSELGVVTCAAKLPLPACDQPQAPCSDPSVILTASGCALPADQHALGGIHYTTTYPKDLTIEIERDGGSVGTATLKPSYADVPPPGGEGCGPGCTQANEVVTIHQ